MSKVTMFSLGKSKYPAPKVFKCRICGLKTHDVEKICVVCRILKNIENKCKAKFEGGHRESCNHRRKRRKIPNHNSQHKEHFCG